MNWIKGLAEFTWFSCISTAFLVRPEYEIYMSLLYGWLNGADPQAISLKYSIYIFTIMGNNSEPITNPSIKWYMLGKTVY